MTISIVIAVLLVLSTIATPFAALTTFAVPPSVVKASVAFAVFLLHVRATPRALVRITVLDLG
jgi:hypothetical protein